MADEIKNLSSCTKIDGTEISYSRKDVLGSGTFGTVYLGIFEEKQVTIKKIQLKHQSTVKEDREVKNQLEAEGHENVVQIFETVQDLDFRYIVMELCAGTLGEVIEKKYKGPPLPPDDKVLYQMANGLHHIHSQKLIHRDIKPANVLISYAGRIKWSDFGISKQISTRDTCSMSSGLKGTHSWMAPEFCQIGNNKSIKATPMSDVFPCGCLFFVFVTRKDGGIHPFGDTNDPITIQVNIRDDEQVNINKLQPSHFAAPIIQKMIEHLPEKRIPLSEVKELLLSVSTDERDGPSDNGWGVSGFQPLYNFSDPPSNVMSFFAARAKMEVRGGILIRHDPGNPAHPAVGNSMYPGGPPVGFNPSAMSGTHPYPLLYPVSFNGYPGGDPVGVLPPCPGGSSFGGYGQRQPPQQPMYNVAHFLPSSLPPAI